MCGCITTETPTKAQKIWTLLSALLPIPERRPSCPDCESLLMMPLRPDSLFLQNYIPPLQNPRARASPALTHKKPQPRQPQKSPQPLPTDKDKKAMQAQQQEQQPQQRQQQSQRWERAISKVKEKMGRRVKGEEKENVVDEPQTDYRYCRVCRTRNPKDAKICQACGNVPNVKSKSRATSTT